MPRTSGRLPAKTEKTSARFTAEGKDLLLALCRKFGINESAVLEMAVRRLAEAEGIRPPQEPPSSVNERADTGQGE